MIHPVKSVSPGEGGATSIYGQVRHVGLEVSFRFQNPRCHDVNIRSASVIEIAIAVYARAREIYRAVVMLRVMASLLALAGCCQALSIAAFNIQIFGVTKFSKADVVDTLSQVSSAPRRLRSPVTVVHPIKMYAYLYPFCVYINPRTSLSLYHNEDSCKLRVEAAVATQLLHGWNCADVSTPAVVYNLWCCISALNSSPSEH